MLPLIVLPTTAGTGAETTRFSVLYKNEVKYSVEHDAVLPDYAIVYPPFTYNNNRYLTACTGFDALSQAIEAFWNINATEESETYAEKAIRLLWPNLHQLVNNPTDYSLRDKVSEGSYWAGRAINITKTTAPHAFSYPFTSFYGYPHGHAVALTFPYFMELNCSERNPDRERVMRLLKILDIQPTSNVFDKLQSYVSAIGLEENKEIKIDRQVIMSHVGIERMKNNPVHVDEEIMQNLMCEYNRQRLLKI